MLCLVVATTSSLFRRPREGRRCAPTDASCNRSPDRTEPEFRLTSESGGLRGGERLVVMCSVVKVFLLSATTMFGGLSILLSVNPLVLVGSSCLISGAHALELLGFMSADNPHTVPLSSLKQRRSRRLRNSPALHDKSVLLD